MLGEASPTKRQGKRISFSGDSGNGRETSVRELGEHGEEHMPRQTWPCPPLQRSRGCWSGVDRADSSLSFLVKASLL